MANKKLLFTTLALVAIAALVQVLNSKKTVTEQDFPPLLKSDLINRVDSILIKHGAIDLNFKLADGKWVLPQKENFPAKKAKILALLSHLVRTQPASLVTEDPSRLDDFDLGGKRNEDGEYGSSLKLFSGKETLFHLTVGRAREASGSDSSGPVGAHSGGAAGGVYIRLGQKPQVYLLKDSLHLPYMPEDWLETKIVSLAQAQIQGFLIKHDDKEIEMARKSEMQAFAFKDNINAQPLKVGLEDLFREVENMPLMDVMTHEKAKDLKLVTKAKVVITLFSGVGLAFDILEENLSEERNYYLRLLPPPNKASAEAYADLFQLGEKWIFQIQEWQATKWSYAAENLVPGVR